MMLLLRLRYTFRRVEHNSQPPSMLYYDFSPFKPTLSIPFEQLKIDEKSKSKLEKNGHGEEWTKID
jgi:hypothetical protein